MGNKLVVVGRDSVNDWNYTAESTKGYSPCGSINSTVSDSSLLWKNSGNVVFTFSTGVLGLYDKITGIELPSGTYKVNLMIQRFYKSSTSGAAATNVMSYTATVVWDKTAGTLTMTVAANNSFPLTACANSSPVYNNVLMQSLPFEVVVSETNTTGTVSGGTWTQETSGSYIQGLSSNFTSQISNKIPVSDAPKRACYANFTKTSINITAFD